MNDNWYFTEEYSQALPTASKEDLLRLTQVRIPHTVKMMELNYCSEQDYQMESGYVRMLQIPEEWRGRRILLTFGGAAHEAEVFCNGKSLYTHHCGYTAFTVDLTETLHFGEENQLTVRLDSRENLNIPPFGHAIDYMTFGGLYRAVTLEVKESSYLKDVFVHGGMDRVLQVEMEGCETQDCRMMAEVTDHQGKVLAQIPEQDFSDSLALQVTEAKLWDIRNPQLYTFTVHLRKAGREIDTQSVHFGFREFRFTAQGFYLNGKKVKLRGLNRHQSYPYMGYAAPDRAQALDADILKKELGCNAVRTSHYPQSHAFLDRCDELGLLVFTEMPGWQHIGDEAWKQQAVQNTRDMVKQYRNHPCIFLWGVRINESQDDDEMYRSTNAAAHELDPSRPTGGVRCIKKSHLLEDVYTYNDFFHNGTNKGCEPKKKITPDMSRGYLISEYNGHMFPTKPYDWEEKRLEHALRHAQVLDAVRQQRDIAGCFGWCMFDYNTHQDFGSGDRVCYHGVLDMFRNPKMAAAVYAAEGLNRPVLEISSSMDIGEHPACNLGEIYAFTNADYVELYKNDEFVAKFAPGKKFPHMKHPPILIDDPVGCLLEKHEGYDAATAAEVKKCLFAIARYGQAALPPAILLTVAKLMAAKHFTYEKGNELYGKYIANWGEKMVRWHFVAIKNGKKIAETWRGPAENVHLQVMADTETLQEAETWDMATVRIRAVDGSGNLLPYCTRVVSLEAEGAIALVGPAHLPFAGGSTGTYVRTTGESGMGKLTIHADGMKPVILTFDVQGREGTAL